MKIVPDQTAQEQTAQSNVRTSVQAVHAVFLHLISAQTAHLVAAMEDMQAIMPTCAKRRAAYARYADDDDDDDDVPTTALNLE